MSATFSIEDAKALGANCDECPLRDSFNGVPTSHGSPGDIAVVGEAPGVQEARRGEAFVGPSGKLLDIVLDHNNISREDVTLSNACLCRPPDGKAPPVSAITACRPRLLRELERANTIVALGNSAALATLGVDGVTKLRVGPGKTSPYSEIAHARIIPTVHPAACLRQSDMFPHLVTDIGKIKGSLDAYDPPHWRVLDDPVEAIAALRELEGREAPLVVDIEVDIEKDTAYDHPNRYGLLCVGLGYESGKAIVVGESACASEDVRDALGAVLRTNKLIAQNGKFDLAGLYPVVGGLELWFDTMLASYCLDERPGIHGLKHMAVEYLGAPQYDAEIKKYVGPKDGYGVIPRDLLYKYNAYDIDCTFKLYELLSQRLEEGGLRELHDFLVEASNELMYLELNGFPVDREYIEVLTDQYMESLGQIEGEIDKILVAAGYMPINPRSPKQVKEALLHLKIKVESTNEETLNLIIERLQRQPVEGIDHALEFCQTLLKHRREAKMYGTYVKGIAKRLYNGRVYPSFLLHGTTTGRLACRNPNLQNVPRESAIRNLFVPSSPERVLVQADYGQAELRVLTWFAKEEYFREILNDPNRDLFDELTPILYPNAGDKASMDEADWKELRIRVKAFVYGLGYGRTHYTIASEFKMSEREALAVKDRFFEAIPSIVDFQRQLKKQVKDGKDLVTPFGRHRRFWLITEENWKSVQNEALAFLPQSTSSDLCLRAMARTRRELSGTGCFIRNIVHDSIVVDCPDDMADDVSRILDKNMVDSADELVEGYVSFRTDVHVGKRWGEV